MKKKEENIVLSELRNFGVDLKAYSDILLIYSRELRKFNEFFKSRYLVMRNTVLKYLCRKIRLSELHSDVYFFH